MASWTSVEKLLVPYLDYETRCNLRLCSKSDKLVVDSCTFFAVNIEISEENSGEVVDKSWVRVDIDTFSIWFIGKNDVTRVDRAWSGELQSQLSELRAENRYDVARRFLGRYGPLAANRITIRRLTLEPNFMLTCHELSIRLTDAQVSWAPRWLQNVDPPKLEKFEANCWNLDGIGDVISRVDITKSLKLGEESDLTDEQLDGVGALHLNIDSNRLTLNGVKRALERFLKNGKRDDELILHAVFPDDFDPVSLFSESLRFKEKPSRIPSEKKFLITGGFTNTHRVQDAREFNYTSNSIFCFIRIPPKNPGHHIYHLWPLTHHF